MTNLNSNRDYQMAQGMRIASAKAMEAANLFWVETPQGKAQHPDCTYPDCTCLGTSGECVGP